MSAILFYATKEIKKNKKAFIFIVIAIALSTANIIMLNGIMTGVNEDLVARTIDTSSAHLSIYPDNMDRYIEGLGIKEQKLETFSEIVGYSPRINAGGAISHKEKSKSIKIIALDPSKENKVTALLTKIESGETLEANNEILVSYHVAEDLKAGVGDPVTILFENGNTKIFQIKGILRTGTSMDMDTVIINFEDAEEQIDLNNKASIILIRLSDINLSGQYKNIIVQELELEKVKEWKQEVESIISTSETFKDIGTVVNGVGLFASAISVGVIFYINILHKSRQIGIMKAIGMKDSQILSIYIIQGTLIGSIGIIIGDIMGYASLKYLEAHPFTDPTIGNMVPKFYTYLVYDASLITLLVVILASLYPAVIAARMNIIKAIWET